MKFLFTVNIESYPEDDESPEDLARDMEINIIETLNEYGAAEITVSIEP